MDAFRTRKTFHELYLHRVVLENDSQCWSVTGADQWNVGIILMSIAKNSNTLPAEKRMEVMNSTPQFSTSWKPLKAQSCGWQQSRDDSTNQFEALRTIFSLGFCKRQTSYLFELCITRWFLIDSRLLVKCKIWLSMTVASCCLYLPDHPKFGQGSLQNFNLMNLNFCARMTLAGLLTSWLHRGQCVYVNFSVTVSGRMILYAVDPICHCQDQWLMLQDLTALFLPLLVGHHGVWLATCAILLLTVQRCGPGCLPRTRGFRAPTLL